jgi:predicted lipoprotein
MKQYLKYLFALILLLFVGYHSVYFKNLKEMRASVSTGKINIASYTKSFWNQRLIPSLNKSLPLNQLLQLLKTDPKKTFKEKGNALGIGELKYFMVKGEGKVENVNENEIIVHIQAETQNTLVRIATEYVYGNAVRDASGLITMIEFDNTSDFNEVSAGINKIIREEVISDFKKKIKMGDRIQFTGAIELNSKSLELNEIEITPVQLKILN